MSRVYDQWLDSRKHDSDEFMHEFEMRTERYLQTEWNPQNYEVFMEALFDVDFEPWREELKTYVAEGTYGALKLGVVIWAIINDYCTAKAKAKARQDMEQS